MNMILSSNFGDGTAVAVVEKFSIFRFFRYSCIFLNVFSLTLVHMKSLVWSRMHFHKWNLYFQMIHQHNSSWKLRWLENLDIMTTIPNTNLGPRRVLFTLDIVGIFQDFLVVISFTQLHFTKTLNVPTFSTFFSYHFLSALLILSLHPSWLGKYIGRQGLKPFGWSDADRISGCRLKRGFVGSGILLPQAWRPKSPVH
jgi:hypothetical protein